MNKNELKNKLLTLKISECYYSLDGDLLPDRTILYKSGYKWLVFYFDERGNRDKEMEFSSESEACIYLYDILKKEKELEDSILKNSTTFKKLGGHLGDD